jgi:hypothetical protein
MEKVVLVYAVWKFDKEQLLVLRLNENCYTST